MLPDRVSNPRPLTYKSGALPIALRGPAQFVMSLKIWQSMAYSVCHAPTSMTPEIIIVTTDVILMSKRFVVVVALLFYVHGKHLRSCRDCQLT